MPSFPFKWSEFWAWRREVDVQYKTATPDELSMRLTMFNAILEGVVWKT